tara:strand:+ start:177 stop:299 length:123 start_codon:yes stop_codon:yes gene_type:complete
VNRQEFQQLHGFDDEDMERIDLLVKAVGGKITEINERIKK